MSIARTPAPWLTVALCWFTACAAGGSTPIDAGHPLQTQKAGLDTTRYQELLSKCLQSKSDALIIIKDGDWVEENYFGHKPRLLPVRSVTKSIVSLAVGLLVSEGKIPSVDTPLSTWFPEWGSGRKAKVRLRHILEHTSGLEHRPADGMLMSQHDSVAYARRLAVLNEPGLTFSYNNEAVQLLAEIIKASSGRDVEDYLRDRLFTPLGISHWHWDRDPSGNAYVHGGLKLKPRDLARIGQLLLKQGHWNGKTLIPPEWIRTMTRPSVNPDYGELWWLLDDGGAVTGCFYASGWLGQTLAVCPEVNAVGVRMREGSRFPTEAENAAYGFLGFPAAFRRLFHD